jgi:predicted ATP-grasp superfamily ATP-dependent carboligase
MPARPESQHDLSAASDISHHVKRILVTGAGGSAASNFVYSLRLAAEPFFVVGADISPYHLELADVDARYLLPRADDPAYIDELNALIELERVEFVHPQPDPETVKISSRRADIAARTFLPNDVAVQICQDKVATARRLAEADVPVPLFCRPSSETDLADATAQLVADRGKAWVRALRGAGSRASLPVMTGAQAVAWVRYWSEMRGLSLDDFMVSEFLPGREFAFQSLWRDGEIVTSQARERLEYVFGHLTPSGQSSSPSVARTVQRRDVNDAAARAVRAIDSAATGVFCVDLKENAEGAPVVTEINAGRFFTTSNFLAQAGANMPHTYVRLGYGETVEDLPKFDAVEADLYWVRMIDMGFKLVRGDAWTSRAVTAAR